MIKRFIHLATALSLCILFVAPANAQQIGKQKKELFSIGNGNYKTSGWHLAPGITYMIPTLNQRNEYQIDTEVTQDTLYNGNFNAGGKLGWYFEFGRHKFYEKKLLTYIDYGLAYKVLRGTERFEGHLGGGATRVDYTYDEKFSNHFADAFINFNKIGQLGNYSFIQNSLGLNFDYRFINNQNSVAIETQTPMPGNMMFQLHYKLGFGFKANKNLYIVPTIETPILNIVEWADGKSTLGYFNSQYRPIIFSVRFFWFDKQKQADCSGAVAPSSPELFGKDMRKGMSKSKKGYKRRR